MDSKIKPSGVIRPAWALLMSSKTGRIEDLTAEWSRSKHGEAILKAVRFDPEVVQNKDEAAVTLRNGVAGGDAVHFFLVVGGELAGKLRLADLEKLVDVSLRGKMLIVMGLADNEAERKALDKLGLKYILSRGASGQEIFAQFKSARDDLVARLSPRDESVVSIYHNEQETGAEAKKDKPSRRFGLGKKQPTSQSGRKPS